MSKVTIIPDENGNVIRQSKNNPLYGHVRVQQERVVFNGNWLNRRVVSTLIQGKLEDLTLAFSNVKTLPGKIVVKESLTPFNESNPDRDLKIAGTTGIVCRVGDEPIYRTTIYTNDTSAEDVLVAHTNADEIRSANNTAVNEIISAEFVNVEDDSFEM